MKYKVYFTIGKKKLVKTIEIDIDRPTNYDVKQKLIQDTEIDKVERIPTNNQFDFLFHQFFGG